MIIKFNKAKVEVEPYDKENFISPHTDNTLEKFRVDISVNELATEALYEDFDHASENGVVEVDKKGKVIKEYDFYEKGNYSSSNSELKTFTVILTEKEEAAIDELIINDITLLPYEYKERYEEAIIISAKVEVTNEEAKNIDKLNGYFPVVRKGINNRSLNMRFGQNIWSKKNDEIIKYDLTIVEDKYDENNNRNNSNNSKDIEGTKFRNLANIALNQKAYIKLLTDLLVEKEILNSKEIEDIRKRITSDEFDYDKLLYQVDDIDK